MWLSRGSYSCSKLKLKFNKNVKLAFSRAHAYDLYENRNQLNYLPFRTYINSNLDVIHFISEDGMKYHIKKYGKISSDRRISRLGTINKKNIIKKIIRKNYISIASCSSITDIKRLDLIIDILSSLKIKFKWIHIGDGCKKCEIINYAKKKLSDKDFEFLGQVDNSLILNKYYDYDVDYFINLSDSEGIPVSIMEVFSMGIPTIARNVGGISEIVNNLNGLVLSEKFDLEKYSKIINSEIENRLFNEDIYLSKSKKALQTWEKLYNAEENYDKFFNINEE
jgi:glycosyltransferase involved in cell wall biosynthesis